MTGNSNGQGGCEIIQFGRRPVPPRACQSSQSTDIRHQHAAGRRLRDIETILAGATDRDVGAVRPRA